MFSCPSGNLFTNSPDCVADFTTIHLEYDGRNRVRVFGIEGRPATEFLKVSISYSAGFKAVGTLVYAWPEAYDKAQAANRILRTRLENLQRDRLAGGPVPEDE